MALYKDKMWFGTRNYMQWIPAPQINYDSSKRGFVASAAYINGGQFVRRSATAAKGYVFTWNLKTRDEIRAINDYADGVYGIEPIYFLDPFAMDKNLLPQYFATPYLGYTDAPLLAGEFDEDRPSIVPTSPNTLGYPTYTAAYNLQGTGVNPVFIPIPPGYSLWVGAHGESVGTAGVIVTPTVNGAATNASILVPLLSVQTTTRVNTQVNGDTYNGALVSVTGTGTLNLTGLIAQVLPNGKAPETGGFISGQGHSGCSFTEEPTLTNYSVGINKVGISANLVETEGWK